jgi:hypothetical protein
MDMVKAKTPAARHGVGRGEYESSEGLSRTSFQPLHNARTRHSRVRKPVSQNRSVYLGTKLVAPASLEAVRDSDFATVDPGRSVEIHTDSRTLKPPWLDTLSLLPPLLGRSSLPMSALRVHAPKSRVALYQNLVSCLQGGQYSPALSALLDYHSSFDPEIRSTRSFNLLLALAIKQTSFGVAWELLDQMKRESVASNFETRKLLLRLLVRTGRWDEAWRVVSEADAATEGTISLWLELFDMPKRGALRDSKLAPLHEYNDSSELSSLHADRYQFLLRKLPYILSHLHIGKPIRLVGAIVRALMYLKHHRLALQLVTDYLRGLPGPVDAMANAQCLSLVHLLLVPLAHDRLGTLAAHRVARKVLAVALEEMPGLKPNSTTLYLLLASLKNTRMCGTRALRLTRQFTRQWGEAIADRRVWRRVAALAVKEGRFGIFNNVILQENRREYVRRIWSLSVEVNGGRGPAVPDHSGLPLVRNKNKTLQPKRGKEGWKWRLLRRRFARIKAGTVARSAPSPHVHTLSI